VTGLLDLTIHDSNPDKAKKFLSFPKRPDRLWDPHQPPVQWVLEALPQLLYDRSLMLTNHLGLVSRLRMSGTVPPFSLYTIITSVETILSFWHIEGTVCLTKNPDQTNSLQLKYSTDMRCQTGLCDQSALSTFRRNPRERQSYSTLAK